MTKSYLLPPPPPPPHPIEIETPTPLGLFFKFQPPQKARFIKVVACAITLTYFFLHMHSSAANKKVSVIAVFFSKLDYTPLFSYLGYENVLAMRIGFSMNNKWHTLSIV